MNGLKMAAMEQNLLGKRIQEFVVLCSSSRTARVRGWLIQTHDSVRLKPSSSSKSTSIGITARQHTAPEPVRGPASSSAAGRPYPPRSLPNTARARAPPCPRRPRARSTSRPHPPASADAAPHWVSRRLASPPIIGSRAAPRRGPMRMRHGTAGPPCRRN